MSLIYCACEHHAISGTALRGAMVVALLLCLAFAVVTGLVFYAEEKGGGPLAPLYLQTGAASQPNPAISESIAEGYEREGDDRESAFKEVHELFANITLALVILHVLGVALASFAHHENLARAMITVRKRPN